ncbi:MAG: triose-phosphate isomerase [Nitrospirae bacterium]|nr:triose-phosphate isomerase [Nitrospirota bacterium]MDA1303908.1 triose-phosphate isomerase [Nitrospirota bacterium]
MRTRLIAGNWKMHKTAAEAVTFVHEFRKVLSPSTSIDIVLAPPFVSLFAVQQAMTQEDRFAIAAQNLYWETEGAYTGEVSGSMLQDLGCTYVIVGHSERRHLFGEKNDEVNKKVKAALAHGLIPILCVGETLEEREAGNTQAVVKDQLLKGLSEVGVENIPTIIIAYEPVWAIGTGRAASVEQAEEVHAFLRATLSTEFGEISQDVRILYGGSVSPQNAEALFSCKEIDGALIGKACLDPVVFAKICGLADLAST